MSEVLRRIGCVTECEFPVCIKQDMLALRLSERHCRRHQDSGNDDQGFLHTKA